MAKKFSFNLQKILDLRSFEEQQAEIELGRALSEKNKLELSLQNLAAERIQVSLQKRSADIRDFAVVDMHIRRLDVKKEQLLNDLAQAELVAEQKKEKYFAARQKREVLDKLCEKKETAYKKECAVKEENEILNRPFQP